MAVAVAAGSAQAQGGENAAVFLELPASARAMALGSGYGAVGGDEAVIFYNPAQLATVSAAAAGLSVQRYIQSSTLGALSAATRMGRATVGLGVQVLNYGSEAEIVPDTINFGGQRGTPTGANFSAADMAFSLGAGAPVGYGVRVGATAKLVYQHIADVSGTAPAFDVGVARDFVHGLTVAAAIQNVGGELKFGSVSRPLPRVLRVGAALPVALGHGVVVALNAEGSQVRGGDFLPSGGAELSWRAVNGIALLARVGVPAQPSGSAAGSVAFGGGIAAEHLAIDYAFQQMNTLGGATHRIGVRWWR